MGLVVGAGIDDVGASCGFHDTIVSSEDLKVTRFQYSSSFSESSNDIQRLHIFTLKTTILSQASRWTGEPPSLCSSGRL